MFPAIRPIRGQLTLTQSTLPVLLRCKQNLAFGLSRALRAESNTGEVISLVKAAVIYTCICTLLTALTGIKLICSRQQLPRLSRAAAWCLQPRGNLRPVRARQRITNKAVRLFSQHLGVHAAARRRRGSGGEADAPLKTPSS